MSNLCRITTITRVILRVPRGQQPHVDLDLLENQEIVAFNLEEHRDFFSERVTTDWTATISIATRL